MEHISILLKEVIEKLEIDPQGIYVDATMGLGGHSQAILEKLDSGKLIAIDQDKEALKHTKKKLHTESKNIFFVKDNFKNIKTILEKLNINKVNGFLYDLGTSYYQLTSLERGFTYQDNSILDMRMDENIKWDAKYVLNNYSKLQLENIFKNYGDEKKYKQIALEIINERKKNKIINSTQLNALIKKVKGWDKKNPYKNIYQALRIEVNDELNSIKKSIISALDLLDINGKILVITFHSLEDKIIKQIFYEYKNKVKITPLENKHFYRTQKTIYPSNEEIKNNNASRSAKLRIIKRIN